MSYGPGAPEVETGSNTPAIGSATLYGTVTATNGAPTTAFVYYGPTDGGINAAEWAYTNTIADPVEGVEFDTNTVGTLLYGQPYFYRCFASNEHGTAWSAGVSSNFMTLAPGGIGITTTTVETNHPSYTLNGTLQSAGAVFDVWVHWGTNDGQNVVGDWDSSNLVCSVTNVSSTNLVFTNLWLSEKTEYSYAFLAQNDATNMWAQPSETFTTPGAPEVETGSNTPAIGSATLYGTVTATNGAPTTAFVYYGPTDGGINAAEWAYTNTIADPVEGVEFDTNTVGTLLYGQPYFYRCFASNEHGTAWSAGVSSNFMTLAPGGIGITTTTVETNHPSYTLNGTLQSAGAVFDVWVHWGTNDGQNVVGGWDSSNHVASVTNVASTDLSFPVGGLEGATEYHFRYMATNPATNMWSDTSTSFTTLSGGGPGAIFMFR